MLAVSSISQVSAIEGMSIYQPASPLIALTLLNPTYIIITLCWCFAIYVPQSSTLQMQIGDGSDH